MESQLKLSAFVALDGLHNQDQIPDDCFALLGAPLGEWVRRLLVQNKVSDVPVIHGTVHSSAVITGAVYVAAGAVVEPHCFITGPAYIGPDSEVRHGAYIRGNVYVGRHCVVGHTTEAKGSVFLDGAKAAHFAYVGDSILGRNVNLGAGTRLANLKMRKSPVKFKHPVTHQVISSGLTKFGAILGDRAQTGCNAVLSPGTLLMPQAMVSPCTHFHGTLQGS